MTKRFAKIENGIVTQVIVTETKPEGDWVETFKNAYPNPRKQYAGIGDNWNGEVFYSPQPYPSWILNDNYDWEAPIPMPEDGKQYLWDEETQSWQALGEEANEYE
jgi:hypothetical protein